MNVLAKRLARRIRELHGEEPQLRFARKLGISKSSLNRMEMAEQNVSLQTLDTRCRRLKCDVAELFATEAEPSNPD